MPAKAACEYLAEWEDSDSSETVGTDTDLQEEFAATTMPLSGDFAVWVSEVQTGSPDPGGAADQVASDCAALGVTIFPPASAPSTVAPSAPSASAAPSTSAPSLAGKTVASFSGSGIETTPQFTVTSTWKLDYSFDCSSFGQSGNFAVYEYSGSTLDGVLVNDLAMSKSGSTYAYEDAGTRDLEIDSECSWSVEVIDGG